MKLPKTANKALHTIASYATKCELERSVKSMKYLKSTFWIIVFSIIGGIQVTLLIGGMFYFKEFEGSPPWAHAIMRHGGGIFILISLLWPFYMVIAGKKSYKALAEENNQLKERLSESTEQ